MPRRSSIPALIAFTLAAAGCRGGDVSLGGTFRDPVLAADSSLTVWAVEAQREAPVRGGAFELNGLVAGPVTLEVRSRGRAIARVEVPDLPGGARLEMLGLRVDPASGRAFPASVSLRGAKVATVNGIRVAAPDRLSGDVDVRGTVLARSEDGAALLLRAADSTLPDLRVVVMPSTQAATPDGDPVPAGRIARGDSLRVKGRRQGAYVMAAGIEVPRIRALSGPGDPR
jgi:hypothetical protein